MRLSPSCTPVRLVDSAISPHLVSSDPQSDGEADCPLVRPRICVRYYFAFAYSADFTLVFRSDSMHGGAFCSGVNVFGHPVDDASHRVRTQAAAPPAIIS